jgi:hypothetical protein
MAPPATDVAVVDQQPAEDPKSWYVIVSGWVEPYLTNFTTMQDPSLKPFEISGKRYIKLTSASFDRFMDYEEVLKDAREVVQLITGAMNINQDPGTLKIVNVVAVLHDGTTKEYPPYGRARSARFGIPTLTGWVEGATPRVTFEQSVFLYARQSANPPCHLSVYQDTPEWREREA